jgi:hypothetical protein
MNRSLGSKSGSRVSSRRPIKNANVVIFLCRTLKMSHDYSWRGVCASTTRESCGRWLGGLVRLIFHR